MFGEPLFTARLFGFDVRFSDVAARGDRNGCECAGLWAGIEAVDFGLSEVANDERNAEQAVLQFDDLDKAPDRHWLTVDQDEAGAWFDNLASHKSPRFHTSPPTFSMSSLPVAMPMFRSSVAPAA